MWSRCLGLCLKNSALGSNGGRLQLGKYNDAPRYQSDEADKKPKAEYNEQEAEKKEIAKRRNWKFGRKKRKKPKTPSPCSLNPNNKSKPLKKK